ncbi:MAG: RsmE family RNA methyltransferase [Synergistaceae bacterium]|nr:RsmE family RNA methyltransferase [Synergistaceae bacterium]
MSLPRLRLESCLLKDGLWLIDTKQAHHLVKVRRCYNGSLVEGLLDGEKLELRLICDGESVRAEELSRKPETPSGVEIHLLLAVLKNDQFDDALRFAAETGVSFIHLLACERSVPVFEAQKSEEKLNRWRRILDESTKQAGSTRPPVISAPIELSKFDFTPLPKHRYAALLSDAAKPLREMDFSDGAAVAIGPEGDWAPHEAQTLLDNGFAPVSLGRRILRASTAVAVACGWISNTR